MRRGRLICLIAMLAVTSSQFSLAMADQKPAGRGPLPRQTWPTDALVSEVQERLYHINAAISSIDGQLNAETLAAIRAWQLQFGFASDGYLTDAQIDWLRRSVPPEQWAAIAYDRSGRVSITWDEPTRRGAEAAVIDQCRSQADGECRVIAVTAHQCAAVVRYRPARALRAAEIYVARHAGLGSAEILALSSCARAAHNQGSCDIVAQVCPNGPHPVVGHPVVGVSATKGTVRRP